MANRPQSGFVYQPTARGEILRAVFGGTIKAGWLAIKAFLALIFAAGFVVTIILGAFK